MQRVGAQAGVRHGCAAARAAPQPTAPPGRAAAAAAATCHAQAPLPGQLRGKLGPLLGAAQQVVQRAAPAVLCMGGREGQGGGMSGATCRPARSHRCTWRLQGGTAGTAGARDAPVRMQAGREQTPRNCTMAGCRMRAITSASCSSAAGAAGGGWQAAAAGRTWASGRVTPLSPRPPPPPLAAAPASQRASPARFR